jgi:hypothetical protein
LAIDLYCGLGGWAEGFLAERYRVVGFDIERRPYPGLLVLQDVLTLHGSQFRDAAVIVASPPCQAYSYRAMPWKRAKALPPPSNELFDACFRIQREASEAAGHHIPMVVENVKGAQPWVGRAAWHYGSYYLWGDVPALMPMTRSAKIEGTGSWFYAKDNPDAFCHRKNGHMPKGLKNNGGSWFAIGSPGQKRLRQNPVHEGAKNGNDWFGSGENCSLQRRQSSRSDSRKAASALIAKIPFGLSQWIAKVYIPEPETAPGDRSQRHPRSLEQEKLVY